MQPSKSFKRQSMKPGEVLCQLERGERHRMRKKLEKRHYHHVPCSAASDFARTTTPDPLNRGQIRWLSRPAGEYFLGTSPCEVHATSFGVIEDVFEGAMETAVARTQLSRAKFEVNRETILRKMATRRSLDVYQQLQRSNISPNASTFSEDEFRIEPCRKVPSRERSPLIPRRQEDRPKWAGLECTALYRKSSLNPLNRKNSEILAGMRLARNPEESTRVADYADSDFGSVHGGSSWKCACFLG
ncbi:hypothetical protein RUND412_004677 [Rhizina undulata]